MRVKRVAAVIAVGLGVVLAPVSAQAVSQEYSYSASDYGSWVYPS